MFNIPGLWIEKDKHPHPKPDLLLFSSGIIIIYRHSLLPGLVNESLSQKLEATMKDWVLAT